MIAQNGVFCQKIVLDSFNALFYKLLAGVAQCWIWADTQDPRGASPRTPATEISKNILNKD
jgi:hypothetical protein